MTDAPGGSSGWTVRPAKESDVEDLFDIRTSVRENHQSRAELEKIGVTPATVAVMLRTDSAAWIAEAKGYPVGFSMANGSEAVVFAMFIRPGFEGLGIGRELMRLAEDWLFSGADEIWLTTGADPTLRAHGFYRHLGWTAAEAVPDGQIKYIKRRSPDTRSF
jgi:GNAT superfamily N-acetyltransferase